MLKQVYFAILYFAYMLTMAEPVREVNTVINLNNTAEIDFVVPTADINAHSVLVWIKPVSYNAIVSRVFQTGVSGSGTDFEAFGLHAAVNGTELYLQNQKAGGVWITNTDPVVVGSIQHIAFTYDPSSSSNDPIIYHNGVSVSFIETPSPSAAGTITSANFVKVGRSTVPCDGFVYSMAYYNRILSASEILDAYNSRKAIPTYRGLVFAPDLRGAVGVDDGDTLGGTNYVRDLVSGATGTPAGSPVFYADNYLNWR